MPLSIETLNTGDRTPTATTKLFMASPDSTIINCPSHLQLRGYRKKTIARLLQLKMVPRTGIEPVRALGPRDFKSLASASSATPANKLEAAPRIELGVKDLQSSALPLGYAALMERKTGFEPATLALARRCSTTEPLPHNMVPQGRIELPTRGFSVHCSTD